jgi:hypothetical protein
MMRVALDYGGYIDPDASLITSVRRSFLENTGKDKLCNVKVGTSGKRNLASPNPTVQSRAKDYLLHVVCMLRSRFPIALLKRLSLCCVWAAGAERYYSIWPEWVAADSWVNDFQPNQVTAIGLTAPFNANQVRQTRRTVGLDQDGD